MFKPSMIISKITCVKLLVTGMVVFLTPIRSSAESLTATLADVKAANGTTLSGGFTFTYEPKLNPYSYKLINIWVTVEEPDGSTFYYPDAGFVHFSLNGDQVEFELFPLVLVLNVSPHSLSAIGTWPLANGSNVTLEGTQYAPESPVTGIVKVAESVQPAIAISSASAGQKFHLGQDNENGRTVTIPLQASANGNIQGDISWTLDVAYESAITAKHFAANNSFTLTPAQCVDRLFPYELAGVGGELTLTATATVDGQTVSDKVVCAVDGYTVEPTDAMTQALIGGYGVLLTGLADTESGYHSGGGGQFDATGDPLFSKSKGGTALAVGLMQIYMAGSANATEDVYSTYWDWHFNALEGIATFKWAKTTATNISNTILKKTPGPKPSLAQIENWADALYKGIAPSQPSNNNANPYLYDLTSKAWVVNPTWASQINVSGQTYKTVINLVRRRAKAITNDPSVDAPGTEMP